MAQRSVFRRKRYLIKKGLQFRYIGVIFALVVLASIVAGYTVFATGWTLLGEKLADVYPQGRLIHVFKTTNLILIRNLLLVSPLIFILGLLFSHKIAGPVYKIERTIYEIAKGNLGLRIRLRKGDELWDLAEVINTMTETLSNSTSSNKDTVLEIQKDLDGIKNLISSQSYDPARLGSSIDNLRVKVKELSSSLDKWTTAS